MTSARATFSRHIRNLFLGGLVVVVPIVLTVNALVWLFRLVDGLAGPLTEAVLGRPVPGIGFATTVLARLPGRTTPGFLTGTFTLRRSDGSQQEVCTVYVPTNHLYVGDVVVLPVTDVIETDLSVEDGVGLMLSAGASVPRVVAER
jgi:uncharacterized membrane protein